MLESIHYLVIFDNTTFKSWFYFELQVTGCHYIEEFFIIIIIIM
jgi:hypothetical protein